VRRDELVDEVPPGSHDLDAVVAGFASERCAAHEGADLALDPALAQRPWSEGRDRRLQARGRDGQRMIAVPARVQDLQCDVAALGMHGSRDRPVPCSGRLRRETAGERRSPAFDVRCKTAGHDQADAASRTLGKIGLEACEFLRVVFEPGVHRAHEDAIAQRHEA